MSVIEIIRTSTGDQTICVLRIDKTTVALTLEPPNLQNKRNISCIPTGSYKYKHYYSTKFQRLCIALYDVPDRNYIAVHPGNTSEDTQGCILVGQGIKNDQLFNSKKALDAIINKLTDSGTITITECY